MEGRRALRRHLGARRGAAALGGRARLPRNRFAGVRTRSSLRSGPAFVVANKVAAPLLGAAGAVGLVGGAVVLSGPPVVLAWIVTGVSVIALLVLSGLGGALGDRAAAALVAEMPAPETCGGACTGCDLVAGCRPDV
ncbi:SdpI family protein, partial [Pseudonocardia sp. KRD291]|uniref:SdpI family protein n=1 Tax=Pseudonocardia sp. KRD291 TaxID=2792007 RepID=UPI001C4A54B4